MKNVFYNIVQSLIGPFRLKVGREDPSPIETRSDPAKLFTSDSEIKIIKDFLSKNKYSRPGRLLSSVNGIVIHWVANPRTSAKANRNYFENRKGGKYGYGSAHFFCDLDGDIIQVIPEKEVAYNCGARSYIDGIQAKLGRWPNGTTLSIECCHEDWAGEMSNETYGALVKLTAHLCRKYGLDARHLYLHYDVTGKRCHRWFVDNPQQWAHFKNTIDKVVGG